MAKVEFKIPCKGKRGAIEYKTKSGNIAFFDVAGEKIKFVLQADSEGEATELTHYASGFVFGRLNPVKVQHLVSRGSYSGQLSDRGAAEILIGRAIDRIGADKVLATLKAAPVINA
jgi:hypothetical protein